LSFSREPRRARPTLGAALAVLAALGGVTAAHAQTPTVRYAPESGARNLIFVNNPEQIVVNYTAPDGITYSDLADPGLGQKSVLRVSVGPGSHRNFFEHLNHNAGTHHYGVQVYNPSTTATVSIIVRGKGFNTGRFGDAARPVLGGQPFVEALNNRTATSFSLAPGRSAWIFRSDADWNNTRPIQVGDFFSGVVDFDVSGGSVFVTNLAYQNFANLTSWSYMGFIQRQPAKATDAPESRVYKGTMGGAVSTSLSFSINDSTPIGERPVQYPRYKKQAATTTTPEQFVASTQIVTGPNWYTHDMPWRESDTSSVYVVSNDLFNISMPGFGTVYALQPTPMSSTPYAYANLANWGVEYRQKISITNTGTRSRSFQMRLGTATGGGAPVAYRGSDGVWRQSTLGGGALPYFSGTVPANSTRSYEAWYIIGGPAVGKIRNSLYFTN
jgi:hypothetical protein